MDSGDGLIVRVKPRGARLTLEAAEGIGRAAQRFGTGALDLTGRANLQIRGVGEASLPALTAVLDGLGLLDPSPEAEAVRNVVSSPLAGLDPTAAFDIRPAVAALEARLVEDRGLQGLPAKFGFVVDDGGTFGLDDVPADVRFLAERRETGLGFTMTGDATEPTWCAADRLAETAAAAAGRALAALPASRSAVRRGPPQSGRMRAVPGWSAGTLGIGVPFGRLDAGQFLRLVRSAARQGASELRLTPWRAVLVPGLTETAARRIDAEGLIVDPDDPRLHVAACAGAPGCRRGTTPVLGHAAILAARLAPAGRDRTIRLHVSGCGKGCAHRGEAPLTLVGHDGVYDLVMAGSAGGEPVLHGLGIEDAAARVDAWARGDLRP